MHHLKDSFLLFRQIRLGRKYLKKFKDPFAILFS